MNGTQVFDLAVVGSGGAAMAAAIAARQAGKTVVLVEQATLGGTCVNVGCVPSKTLLAAAGMRHAALANPWRAGTPAGGSFHRGHRTRAGDRGGEAFNLGRRIAQDLLADRSGC